MANAELGNDLGKELGEDLVLLADSDMGQPGCGCAGPLSNVRPTGATDRAQTVGRRCGPRPEAPLPTAPASALERRSRSDDL